MTSISLKNRIYHKTLAWTSSVGAHMGGQSDIGPLLSHVLSFFLFFSFSYEINDEKKTNAYHYL